MVKKKPLVVELTPQYGIDQSQVPIYFVTTPQDWAYCEGRLLKAQIVGLDTETRPVFSKTQTPNPRALLQLAVRDAENNEGVFILDLRQLPAELNSPILSTVFLSDDILNLLLPRLADKFCPAQEHILQVCPHCTLDMLAPTSAMQHHLDNCSCNQ